MILLLWGESHGTRDLGLFERLVPVGCGVTLEMMHVHLFA